MTKIKLISLAALLAACLAAPTLGWAQAPGSTAGLPATEPSFYIEGYLGFGSSVNSQSGNNAVISGNYDPYFQGGLKFGYWFTPQGTYAASWYQEWMKYLGFYTDLSYHALNLPNNSVNISGFPFAIANSSGYTWTWAFMFAARYGFLQDNEVPFGRLQPYVSVGPALFFSGQDYNIAGLTGGNRTNTTVGIATEAGFRYFFTSNISGEASFKYRYFRPSYYFSPLGVEIQPQTNLFSGQFGLAYHF